MFTDTSLLLYRALGLTRQTTSGGPDEEAGSYLVQTGLEQTVQTLKRATQMPLRNPGHFTQIGGEFVFDGSLNPVYTHRMSSTRDHAPIADICEAAGVRLKYVHYEPGPPPPPVHRASWAEGDAEEEDGMGGGREGQIWKSERDGVREEIKMKREMRRERRKVKVVGMDENENGDGSEMDDEDSGMRGLERTLGRVVML
jgi:hypothetical protein